MAITHVDSNSQTTGNGTSVTVTKPTGTTQEDLLLAFFTSNNQNCTPPSGWTEIADEVTEIFRCQVFYKVAGGSEPSNYQFSVAAAAPLVCTVTAIRGIDEASPIDIAAVAETDLTHSEPYTTPGLTGGTGGRLVYFRTVRFSGSTPRTFTASGATELADVGVFSGGTVCYSQGLYMATSDYSGSGSKSGLAITCNGSESHNFVLTVGVKADGGVTGSMDFHVPSLPSVAMEADWAQPAVVDVDMPMPVVSVDAWYGEFEGALDAVVPISVSLAGATDSVGTLDVIVLPAVDMVGETRFFADNVVTPVREERWFVMTQDGYYLGVRFGVDFPMRIDIPLPIVSIAGQTVSHAKDEILAATEAFEPTEIIVLFGTVAATASAEAYGATILSGALVFPESVVAEATADEWSESSPATSVVFTAGDAVATAEASDLIGFSATADYASATVGAYNPSVGNAKNAPAEHVSVSATSNSASVNNSISAPAGGVEVSTVIDALSENVIFTAGHASISCHN